MSAPPANATASAASPPVVPLPPITVRSSSPAPKASVRPVQPVTGSASISGVPPRRSSTWVPESGLTVPSAAQSCAFAPAGAPGGGARRAPEPTSASGRLSASGRPPHESVRKPMGGTRHRLVPAATCGSTTTPCWRPRAATAPARDPPVRARRPAAARAARADRAAPWWRTSRGSSPRAARGSVVEHGAGEECVLRVAHAIGRPRGARDRRRHAVRPPPRRPRRRRRSASASSCTPTTSACRTSWSARPRTYSAYVRAVTGGRHPAAGRAVASRPPPCTRSRAAGLRRYARRRDGSTTRRATSRLSPLLHLGVVSPRAAGRDGRRRGRRQVAGRAAVARLVPVRAAPHPDLADRAVDARFERDRVARRRRRLRGLVPRRDRLRAGRRRHAAAGDRGLRAEPRADGLRQLPRQAPADRLAPRRALVPPAT